MFSERQVKEFTKSAIKSLGDGGWALCTPAIRRAVISEKAFAVVRMQESVITTSAMDNLLQRMLQEAGLADADGNVL